MYLYDIDKERGVGFRWNQGGERSCKGQQKARRPMLRNRSILWINPHWHVSTEIFTF